MKKLDGEIARVLQEIIEEDGSQFEMDGSIYHLTLIDVPDLGKEFDVEKIIKEKEKKRKRRKQQPLVGGIGFGDGIIVNGDED